VLIYLIDSGTVIIQSNVNAELLDVTLSPGYSLGLVQKGMPAQVRLSTGHRRLALIHDGRTQHYDLLVNRGSRSSLDVSFEDIVRERLLPDVDSDVNSEHHRLSNTPNASTTSTTDRQDDLSSKEIDFRQLFARTVRSRQTSVVVDRFEIAKEYSLYKTVRWEGYSEYTINTRSKSFFPIPSDPLERLTDTSDYSDFIRITNAIARGATPSSLETEFLQRARPVFAVRIQNKRASQILLRAIILYVDAVESVLGGGSRVLNPAVTYEIDVPTSVGARRFPVKKAPLVIDPGSFGSFYVALSSTNQTQLDNGIKIYVQKMYRLRISFDFGEGGIVDAEPMSVLL